jgi:hypothetical protein
LLIRPEGPPVLQRRLASFAYLLFLILFTGALVERAAAGQIRITAATPTTNAAKPADAPQSTGLSLNLCVRDSADFPCPTPITADSTYIPAITLTYGQVLDGDVVYSPSTLTFGTIILYKDPGTGPVPICVLAIGSDKSCPPSSTIFDVGNDTLTATLTFTGSFGYAPSTSLPVTVSVTKDTSEIALSSSQQVATLGSPVTITATATGGYGAIPTGQVIFTVDGAPLDPIDLDATGLASFTTSALALGIHNITASYAGSLDFYPAADSPVFLQRIVPPPTVSIITSSLNPSAVGDRVTFTADVIPPAGSTSGLSGTFTFRDGNVVFATQPVVQKGGLSIAQTSISTLGFGSHSITATYSGDDSSTASVSPVLVQQVNYPLTPATPGYTIKVAPSPLSLGVGQTADLSVTVTPINGFSAPVQLSCSGLPNESACTFTDDVIPVGGGTTKLSFSTMAPHDCGSNIPYFTGQASLHRPGGFGLRYGAPLLAGIFILLLPRRLRFTRRFRPLFALVCACGLLTLNGCGGTCTDFGTAPGSYTIKVNGTEATPVSNSTPAGSGAVNVTTSVSVVIKL